MSNSMQQNRFAAISLTKLTATVVGLHQAVLGGFSVIAMEGAPTNQEMVMTALMISSAMALFLCWRSSMIAGWGAIVFALGLVISGIIYNYTLLEPVVLLIGLLALTGPTLLVGLLLLVGSYSGPRDNPALLRSPLKSIVYFFIIIGILLFILIFGLNI
jgi:hypothetical protein